LVTLNIKLTKQLFLFLLLLIIANTNSFAETINVFSDRNPVKLDESFSLIFKSQNSSVESPDFSPLEKDFDILSQNQSSQVQIINGKQSSTKQWTLTLIAKRTGNLTIPVIYFGKEQTAPITIKVQKADKPTGKNQGNLFLEVEATPKTPYVQSQVIYTVRLFYALKLESASLSEPNFSGGEVLVKKLGEDSQYETRRSGKRFIVIERKYALFPQQSGTITIEALNFQAQVRENGRTRFDSFFNQGRTKIKRLRSKTIKLDVKPIPNTFKGKNWIPAKQLILKDSFADKLPKFKVGEPVTRTLTLSADGLTVGQIPEFMKFRKNTDKFKQYTDQPKLDEEMTSQGLKSIRQEKIAIIPSKAGEYTLPAIEIPWWNTETNQMDIIKLPARTIKVAPAPIQKQTLPPQTTVPAPVPCKQQQIDYKGNSNYYYEILTFIFAFGWIITLIACWWRIKAKTQDNKKPLSQVKESDKKTAINNLKKACHNNNAQEAKKALLVLGKTEIEPALQTEIEKLNKILYGNTGENWQGIELWKAFKAQKPEKVTKKDKDRDGLEPLYLK